MDSYRRSVGVNWADRTASCTHTGVEYRHGRLDLHHNTPVTDQWQTPPGWRILNHVPKWVFAVLPGRSQAFYLQHVLPLSHKVCDHDIVYFYFGVFIINRKQKCACGCVCEWKSKWPLDCTPVSVSYSYGIRNDLSFPINDSSAWNEILTWTIGSELTAGLRSWLDWMLLIYLGFKTPPLHCILFLAVSIQQPSNSFTRVVQMQNDAITVGLGRPNTCSLIIEWIRKYSI